ncbi:c-type cytochrome [Mesorhizobium atlanticum]
MHEGIASDGRRLHPAFPYPWFTRATREDVDDIRAYLRTLEPVRSVQRPNEFAWPLNHRFAMAGWNGLFFTPGEFVPDKNKSAEWNRGAYLAEGLGHCGACHTPKDVFGAAKTSQSYQGSEVQNWFAPNLTDDSRTGLGSWSEQDIVGFLKTGRNERTTAYGPMAPVIEDSTSKMTDSDLKAIAVYLKSLPASPAEAAATPAANAMHGREEHLHRSMLGLPSAWRRRRAEDVSLAEGKRRCAVSAAFFGRAPGAHNGGHGASGPGNPNALSMPSFGWKLSDDQIAAADDYTIRNAWGNKAYPARGGRRQSPPAAPSRPRPALVSLKPHPRF